MVKEYIALWNSEGSATRCPWRKSEAAMLRELDHAAFNCSFDTAETIMDIMHTLVCKKKAGSAANAEEAGTMLARLAGCKLDSMDGAAVKSFTDVFVTELKRLHCNTAEQHLQGFWNAIKGHLLDEAKVASLSQVHDLKHEAAKHASVSLTKDLLQELDKAMLLGECIAEACTHHDEILLDKAYHGAALPAPKAKKLKKLCTLTAELSECTPEAMRPFSKFVKQYSDLDVDASSLLTKKCAAWTEVARDAQMKIVAKARGLLQKAHDKVVAHCKNIPAFDASKSEDFCEKVNPPVLAKLMNVLEVASSKYMSIAESVGAGAEQLLGDDFQGKMKGDLASAKASMASCALLSILDNPKIKNSSAAAMELKKELNSVVQMVRQHDLVVPEALMEKAKSHAADLPQD